MKITTFDGKTYAMDSSDFLVDFEQWDKDFAEGMAPSVGITARLSEGHWEVIRFIRTFFSERGYCPLVYQTCRGCGLRLGDLKRLFPAGYLRGACRLAGISYRRGSLTFYLNGGPAREKSGYPLKEGAPLPAACTTEASGKTYEIDSHGFLVDPASWDEQYACFRSAEMKLSELTPDHWRVIRYLRQRYDERGEVPTVFQVCEDNGLELEELERLFPGGYHRGAVKLAGLHVV